MGDLRIRHGLAYGRQNNFYSSLIAGGTAGLFAQGNTAPDVTLNTLFYSNNTGNTTITNFTLRHPAEGNGNLAPLFEGKRIMVMFLDGSTRLAFSTSGPIIGSGTDGLQGVNTYFEATYHTSSWYITDAFRVRNNYLVVDSSNFAQGGFAAQSAINVQGINTVVLNGSGGLPINPLTLALGEEGQEVTLYAVSAALITCNTGGLSNSFIITSTGGTQYRINSASTISFRHIQNYWVESR